VPGSTDSRGHRPRQLHVKNLTTSPSH
jgi:hypothetical protein